VSGAILGAVKTSLILGMVFLAMANLQHPRTREIMERSSLAPLLADGLNLLITTVPGEYKDDLQNGLNQLRQASTP
jgi:hypothetical protein